MSATTSESPVERAIGFQEDDLLGRDVPVKEVFAIGQQWNKYPNTAMLVNALKRVQIINLGDLADLSVDELRESSPVLGHLLDDETAAALITRARALVGDIDEKPSVALKRNLEQALTAKVTSAPEDMKLPANHFNGPRIRPSRDGGHTTGLPVRVDRSWTDGLHAATAYLER